MLQISNQMNEQLIKFIELCLMGGVITEKEREVIFRKSKEFGVPDDECEIILEGLIHQKNSSTNNDKKVYNDLSKEFDYHSRINEDYFNLQFEKLEKINELIHGITSTRDDLGLWLENYLLYQSEKTFLKPYLIKKGELEHLLTMKKRFSLKPLGSLEWDFREKISKILKKEKFIGYYVNYLDENMIEKYYYFLINHPEFKTINQLDKDLTSYLLTDKGVWWFYRKDKEFKSRQYERKSSFFSYNEILSNQDTCYENDKIGLSYVRIELMKIYNEGINIKEIHSLLELQLDTLIEGDNLDNYNLSDEDIKILTKIDHHLKKQVENFNQLVLNSKFEPLYDYYPDTKIKFLKNYENEPLGWKLENERTNKTILIDELVDMYKNLLSYITSINSLRDVFIISSVKHDVRKKNEVILILDDNKVFYDKFQLESISLMENITKGLEDLNRNLVQINTSIQKLNTTIMKGFHSFETLLKNQNKLIGEMNRNIDSTNWFTQLNTYFLYKINKNTKSLKP